MPNGKLTETKLKLLELTKERNEKLLQEAVLQNKNYKELGIEFGISNERVKQILHRYGIRLPMMKGTKKYENWVKRMSEARKGKSNPWKKRK